MTVTAVTVTLWFTLMAVFAPVFARDAGVGPPDAVVHLYATDGLHVTADGRELYVWGYSLEPIAGTATLPLRDDRFHPEHVVVPVGTTVAWINHDPRTHTLEAPVFGSIDLRRDESWSYASTEPGAYAYTCVNHRGMSRVVTVR